MSEFFFNADAASDGDGSAASPFNSLSSLDAALDDGDVVYWKGTVRDAVSFNGYENVRWLPWEAGLNVFGDIELTGGGGSGWVQHGSHSNLYRFDGDAAPSSKPIRALEDWAEPTEADGSDIPESDLEWESDNDLTAAQANAASAVWETSTGYLWIHASDSGTPASNGKTYSYTIGGNAVTLTGCDSCEIVVAKTRCFSQYSGSNGYGIRLLNCQDCRGHLETCIESGWHAGGAVGSDNQRNIVSIGVCWGRNVTTDNSGGYLVAASTDSGATASRGCRLKVGRVYHYRTRLVDGSKVYTSGGTSVFQAHGDGSAGSISDIECGPLGFWDSTVLSPTTDRFEVHDLDTDENVALCGGSDFPSAGPTDGWSWHDYPMRITDGYIHSQRCDTADLVAVRRVELLADDGSASGNIQAVSDVVLFEACTFVLDADSNNNSKWFVINDGGDVRLLGCSWYSIGSTGAGRSMIASMNHTGGMLRLHSCVIDREAGGWMTRDDTGGNIVAANFDVDRCVFNNIQSSRYCSSATTSGGTGARSEDDWKANVAAEADESVYGTDPEFEAPGDGDLRPGDGGWLDLSSHDKRTNQYQGFDRQPWSSRYGAYQRRGGRRNSRGRQVIEQQG